MATQQAAWIGRDVEVAAGAFGGADADGFVGEANGHAMAIRFRIDSHGRDPEIAAGGNDAHGDLSAIGDQDFAKREFGREQVGNAFQAAGWVSADPLTRHSLARLWNALSAQRGYPDAPASTLIYDHAEPDFVFQRSLNDIAKRHHIRIWRTEMGNQEVWLGAATHDMNIKVDSPGLSLTHRVDPRIDIERQKVLDDLTFVGCASPAAYMDRDEAVRKPGARKGIVSDGRIAVIALQSCSEPAQDGVSASVAPARSLSERAARRFFLCARQYLLRDNIYYWAYRVIRWRHTNAQEATWAEN